MTKLVVCNCYNKIKAAIIMWRPPFNLFPFNLYPSISWLLLPNTLIILCM